LALVLIFMEAVIAYICFFRGDLIPHIAPKVQNKTKIVISFYQVVRLLGIDHAVVMATLTVRRFCILQARLFHLTFPFTIPPLFQEFWEMLDLIDVSLPPFLSDVLFCSLPTYFEELCFSFCCLPILLSILVCWHSLSSLVNWKFPHIECCDCGKVGHTAVLCPDDLRRKCGCCDFGKGEIANTSTLLHQFRVDHSACFVPI